MRHHALIKTIIAPVVVLVGTALLSGDAVAQHKSLKDQLVGTWTLVSNVATQPDGSKVDVFGPHPKGIDIFEPDGRVVLTIVRSDLPKFSSNNRATGTADENKAVVQGSIAYIGTYIVNEADKTVSIQIDAATFPNWIGTTQKRLIAISGNELTQSFTGSTGKNTSSKWERSNAGHS